MVRAVLRRVGEQVMTPLFDKNNTQEETDFNRIAYVVTLLRKFNEDQAERKKYYLYYRWRRIPIAPQDTILPEPGLFEHYARMRLDVLLLILRRPDAPKFVTDFVDGDDPINLQ